MGTKVTTVKKTPKRPTVIVRTFSAGTFVGELLKRTGRETVLVNARRIANWKGSNLATIANVGNAGNVRLSDTVARIELLQTTAVMHVLPVAVGTFVKK